MHYKMTTPCDACPFLKGSGFKLASLRQHASGEFACHKQCDLDEDEGNYQEKANGKSAHCAGALIFLEKRGETTQMMRIAERLGMYDHTKLDMNAPVGTRDGDFLRVATPKPQGSPTQPPEGVRTPDKPGFSLSKEVIAMVDEQSQYFVDHIQIRDRGYTEAIDVFRSRHD